MMDFGFLSSQTRKNSSIFSWKEIKEKSMCRDVKKKKVMFCDQYMEVQRIIPGRKKIPLELHPLCRWHSTVKIW